MSFLIKGLKRNNSSPFLFYSTRLYFKPVVYTNQLKIIRPLKESIPIFRVLNPKTLSKPLNDANSHLSLPASSSSSSNSLGNNDQNGNEIGNNNEINENIIPNEKFSLDMYLSMLKLNIMDGILYEAQRQGRISFYMTSLGEEASTVCSAAALNPQDWVFGQYREAGVLMWRGFSYSDFINQCLGNKMDLGKGRQMPVHYGSRDFHFMTISSPLATQIPQAAGMAYGEKYIHDKNDRVVICYFGEGAASEGDFHAGVNIASTLKVPMIFYCRNNEWAISTCHSEQYKGDGIAIRGSAYGIPSIRLDGNDPFAILEGTRRAREIALIESTPVLVEAMTFRLGHHSTSDDSTAYRSKQEMESRQHENPLKRFKEYLFSLSSSIWNQEKEDEFTRNEREIIIQTLKECEMIKKPSIREMFTNVYEEMPWNLNEQWKELKENIEKYPQGYKSILEKFESIE